MFVGHAFSIRDAEKITSFNPINVTILSLRSIVLIGVQVFLDRLLEIEEASILASH